jgi:hypothetical protein
VYKVNQNKTSKSVSNPMSKFNQVLNEWDPKDDYDPSEYEPDKEVFNVYDEEIVLRNKDEINRIVQWAKANNKPAPALRPDGSLATYLTGYVYYTEVDDSDFNRETGYGYASHTEYDRPEVEDVYYFPVGGDEGVSFIEFYNEPENKKLLDDYEYEIQELASSKR